jgi:hypothetical protein
MKKNNPIINTVFFISHLLGEYLRHGLCKKRALRHRCHDRFEPSAGEIAVQGMLYKMGELRIF